MDPDHVMEILTFTKSSIRARGTLIVASLASIVALVSFFEAWLDVRCEVEQTT